MRGPRMLARMGSRRRRRAIIAPTPRTKGLPGIDAGVVPVVPTDADSPAPGQLRILYGQGVGDPRPRPDRRILLTPLRALGARARAPQRHQLILGHVIIR